MFTLYERAKPRMKIKIDGFVTFSWEIFHSLSLQENPSCQARVSALRLFYTTRPTWNNRETLSPTLFFVTFSMQQPS